MSNVSGIEFHSELSISPFRPLFSACFDNSLHKKSRIFLGFRIDIFVFLKLIPVKLSFFSHDCLCFLFQDIV